MPVYKRILRSVVIRAADDFKIVADHGVVRGNAGDWLVYDYSSLFSVDGNESFFGEYVEDAELTPTQGEIDTEAKLHEAVRTGYW